MSMDGAVSGPLRRYAGAVLDLVLPRLCPACGERITEAEGMVCAGCVARIVPMPEPICSVCGMGSAAMDSATGGCDDCPTGAVAFERIVAITPFTDVASLLVERLKYNDRPEYGELFGRLCLAQLAARRIVLEVDAVIPVPLHRTRLRERSYNQAGVIGEHIARGLGVPMREDILRRVKATPSQTTMNRKQRMLNLEGAFVVNPKARELPGRVLLVDDVCTTGATFQACAVALRMAAPGMRVECLAFARTMHKM